MPSILPRLRSSLRHKLRCTEAAVRRAVADRLAPRAALRIMAPYLLRTHQYEAAAELAQRTVDDMPADGNAAAILVRALRCAGRPRDALRAGNQAFQSEARPADELCVESARSAIECRDLAAAMHWIGAAADRPRTRSSAKVLQARLLYEQGDLAPLRQYLGHARGWSDALEPAAVLELAQVAADCGEWQLARSLCQRAGRSRPHRHEALRLYHELAVRHMSMPSLRTEIQDWFVAGGSRKATVVPTALLMAYYEDCDWERVIALAAHPAAAGRVCRIHNALAHARRTECDEAYACIRPTAERPGTSDEEIAAAAQIAKLCGDGTNQIARFNELLQRHCLAPVQVASPELGLDLTGITANVDTRVGPGPLVSVIMTAYGNTPMLDVAIASILHQTYTNLEVILVDDASKDDTPEHLAAWARRDDRVRVIELSRNSGTYVAKNTAMACCSGELITFMDSDDWSHPERIARQVRLLEEHPGARAVRTRYLRVDEHGNIVFRRTAIKTAHITLMIRREVRETLGYFNALRAGADAEYVERIGAAFGADALVLEHGPCLLALQHSRSLSGGGRLAMDWRSSSGPRLSNRLAYRAWHRRELGAGRVPYVPHPLQDRPYDAPSSLRLPQMSGDRLREA